MPTFLIMMLSIAVIGSVISTKILIGSNNVEFVWKLATFIALWLCWMMPVILNVLRRGMGLEGTIFNILSFVGYALFGFAFILFVLLVFRDIFWYSGHGLGKLFNLVLVPSPANGIILAKVNIITAVLAALLSLFSIYQGIKTPEVKEITIFSPKVEKALSIMQINDMHMDRNKPLKWFKNMVERANSYNPDIVVLPGDIVDDEAKYLSANFDILTGLSTQKIYFSIGNHEFYNGQFQIGKDLETRGIKVLTGQGVKVADTPVYIAGIPDIPQSRKSVLYPDIIKDVPEDEYKILLLHNPVNAQAYIDMGFDLVLSGHTHGGQIFPFGILVKYANSYLAGLYQIGSGYLNVSRGAGYWGPSMRFLAPSDMTLIHIKPTVSTQP